MTSDHKHEAMLKMHIVYDYVFREMFGEDQSIKTESRLVVAWGWEGEQEVTANGQKVHTFWGDGNI